MNLLLFCQAVVGLTAFGVDYRLIALILASALGIALLLFLAFIALSLVVTLFCGAERASRGQRALSLLLRSYLEMLRLVLRSKR